MIFPSEKTKTLYLRDRRGRKQNGTRLESTLARSEGINIIVMAETGQNNEQRIDVGTGGGERRERVSTSDPWGLLEEVISKNTF